MSGWIWWWWKSCDGETENTYRVQMDWRWSRSLPVWQFWWLDISNTNVKEVCGRLSCPVAAGFQHQKQLTIMINDSLISIICQYEIYHLCQAVSSDDFCMPKCASMFWHSVTDFLSSCSGPTYNFSCTACRHLHYHCMSISSMVIRMCFNDYTAITTGWLPHNHNPFHFAISVICSSATWKFSKTNSGVTMASSREWQLIASQRSSGLALAVDRRWIRPSNVNCSSWIITIISLFPLFCYITRYYTIMGLFRLQTNCSWWEAL